MQNNKMRKKMASVMEALKFFALNKDGTIEDVATFINKDYTTAMRKIRELEKRDQIRLERLETTDVKGKQRKVYRMMLQGLFLYVTTNKATANSSFGDIVKAHSERLLTFKKWEYFKSKSLEKMIRESFFESLRIWTISTWTTFYLLSTKMGEPSYPKMHSDEGLAKATDIHTLGFTFMLKPPEDVRRILGEKEWAELMKLFEAIEEDYELRMFKKQVLFEFETERQEQLKTLNQWKTLKAS